MIELSSGKNFISKRILSLHAGVSIRAKFLAQGFQNHNVCNVAIVF